VIGWYPFVWWGQWAGKFDGVGILSRNASGLRFDRAETIPAGCLNP
jgi:hypothetical protein